MIRLRSSSNSSVSLTKDLNPFSFPDLPIVKFVSSLHTCATFSGLSALYCALRTARIILFSIESPYFLPMAFKDVSASLKIGMLDVV